MNMKSRKAKISKKIIISHVLASLAALYPGRSVIHGVEFEGVKHVEVSPNSYDSDWKRLWSHMFTNYHLFVIFTNSDNSCNVSFIYQIFSFLFIFVPISVDQPENITSNFATKNSPVSHFAESQLIKDSDVALL